MDHLDGTQIYESFVYSDPTDLDYDPPLEFDDPNPATRTLRYCATFAASSISIGFAAPEIGP